MVNNDPILALYLCCVHFGSVIYRYVYTKRILRDMLAKEIKIKELCGLCWFVFWFFIFGGFLFLIYIYAALLGCGNMPLCICSQI